MRSLLALLLLATAARAEGLSFAAGAQAGEVFPSAVYQSGSNYGLGVGLDYEWRNARAGATLFFGGGGTWGSFALRADAAWLPLEGSWTPYVGGGAGFIALGQKRPVPDSGEGIGPGYMEGLPLLSLEAGVELLRDRRVHLLLGGQLDAPLSRPFECNNVDCSSAGYAWKVRYPATSLVARVVF
jgi:hypothetical protein